MRLVRLEIENLASLEGSHTIEFERDLGDAPMFVIVGPTGAGKSTLLDAIALALFGETPRLSNGRGEGSEDLDARHIMTRGAGRCRAVLELRTRHPDAVNKTDLWRATWSCRRANLAPDGAPQRPMRSLERWVAGEERWQVLVDDDRRKVWEPAFAEALAGLGVAEFQRSMLLAQGEFAALLSATPADKGAILERLTSTDRYLHIGRRCADQTRDAVRELERIERELGGRAPTSDADIAAGRARVDALEGTASSLDIELRQLEAAERAQAEHDALAEAEAEVLADAPRLARDRRARAAIAETAAEQRLTTLAEQRVAAARQVVDELAQAPVVRDTTLADPSLAARRARIAQLTLELADAERLDSRIAARSTELSALDPKLTALAESLPGLRRAAADAQVRQALEAHRGSLVAGEPCPLCGAIEHPFHAGAPAGDAAATLVRAERELRTLELARKSLAEALAADRATAARMSALEQTKAAEVAALALAETGARALADQRAHEREQRVIAGRTALAAAEGELAAHLATIAATLARFDTPSLDALRADLLPSVLRDRLEARSAFVISRRASLAAIDKHAGEYDKIAGRQRLIDLQAARAEAWQSLGAEKRELTERVAHRAATAGLQAAWDEARTRADTWRRLHRLIGERDGQAFREYAQILNLEVLVDCANQHLRTLAPRFRLTTADDRNGRARLDFAIRDMAQAGRVRPITTLSGGETFLVSLALALGLADLRTSALPIETLLLDEGFGTLDADARDLALAALEELQARTGLQLGIITHMGSVSERIPARIIVEPAGGAGGGPGRSRLRVELG